MPFLQKLSERTWAALSQICATTTTAAAAAAAPFRLALGLALHRVQLALLPSQRLQTRPSHLVVAVDATVPATSQTLPFGRTRVRSVLLRPVRRAHHLLRIERLLALRRWVVVLVVKKKTYLRRNTSLPQALF
jgi:hypothetical protein